MEKYDLTDKNELAKVAGELMSGPLGSSLIAVNPIFFFWQDDS